MSKYFFKKFTPDTMVVLADNTGVTFKTNDGLIGYFHTENDGLAQQLKGMIEQQRYGMSEISEEEFHRDYVDVKKNGKAIPQQKLWQRESLGSGGYERGTHPAAALKPEDLQARVAVAGVNGATLEDTAPEGSPVAAVAKPADPKEPPPIVLGKRKKPKTA